MYIIQYFLLVILSPITFWSCGTYLVTPHFLLEDVSTTIKYQNMVETD